MILMQFNHNFLLGKELAHAYAQEGSYEPLNGLWCHYMINGQKEAAQSAWNVLQKWNGRIRFTNILRQARSTGDAALAESLTQMLSSSAFVSKPALGVVYSAWLDVLSK